MSIDAEVVISRESLQNAEAFAEKFKLLDGVPQDLRLRFLTSFMDKIILASKMESQLKQQQALIELAMKVKTFS